MRVIDYEQPDTLTVILHNGKVAENNELRPGLILDYDKSGRLRAIELLGASE